MYVSIAIILEKSYYNGIAARTNVQSLFRLVLYNRVKHLYNQQL